MQHSMIRDHHPYFIKRLQAKLERWYTRHFVAPHLASLGGNSNMMKPWNIDIHGAHINIGSNIHVVTAKDRRVSFSTWQFEDYQGHITLGDNCLVCPGVRLDSGSHITVGDNCMLAAGSYVTDADWHDLYDRTKIIGVTLPVTLADNVWVGDGATICKGVSCQGSQTAGPGSNCRHPGEFVYRYRGARISNRSDQPVRVNAEQCVGMAAQHIFPQQGRLI